MEKNEGMMNSCLVMKARIKRGLLIPINHCKYSRKERSGGGGGSGGGYVTKVFFYAWTAFTVGWTIQAIDRTYHALDLWLFYPNAGVRHTQ